MPRSRQKTVHGFITKIGARDSQSYSAMAGHAARTHLKTRCRFWLPADIVASPMTVAATADRTSQGMATKGEVARYIGRHGTKRVAQAVLIGAVSPLTNSK